MSDEQLQILKRNAATGDPEAVRKLKDAIAREHGFGDEEKTAYGFRSIFHSLMGKYAYIETGVNYAECGKITGIYLDELNRAVAVIEDCHRKNNEDDNGPTWLGPPMKCVEIPSTSVTYITDAFERWPMWKPGS